MTSKRKISGCETPTCKSRQTIYEGFCYECSQTMKEEVQRRREEKWKKAKEEEKKKSDKLKSGGCRQEGCPKKGSWLDFDYCAECYADKKCKSPRCRSLAPISTEFCFECGLAQTKWGRELGAQLQRSGDL